MKNVCGKDANGELVRLGDVVCHTEKVALINGVVVTMGEEYKGEPAVMVDYPGKPGHLNRLCKLTKGEKVVKKTVADYGFAVGQIVEHVKYPGTFEITSDEVGEYRGEPCCYTNGGRPTRFSQIVEMPYQDVKAPAPASVPDPLVGCTWEEICHGAVEDNYDSYYEESFQLADGRTLTLLKTIA